MLPHHKLKGWCMNGSILQIREKWSSNILATCQKSHGPYINCEPWFTLRSSWPPAQSPLRVRTHTHTPHTLYYHPLFSNWAFTYTKAWRIKSNCMDKSAHYTHIVLAFIIQRTHFLTCIFHYSLAPRLLPLTDTTQGRGASDTGSGNLSCDPELLTECLIFIAT